MVAFADPLRNLISTYQSNYADAYRRNQQQAADINRGYQYTVANQQLGQRAIAGGYNQLAANTGAGYRGLMQQQDHGQAGVQAGYNNLGKSQGTDYAGIQAQLGKAQGNALGSYQKTYGDVMNTIQGMDQSQLNANAAAYTQQGGQLTQDLQSRGLGNSTIMGSMQQGLLQSKQLADTATRNAFAQTQAGYQANLGSQIAGYQATAGMQQAQLGQAGAAAQQNVGLAGLGYQANAQQNRTALGQAGVNAMQGIGQQGLGYAAGALGQSTGLAENYLGYQGSISNPYPNAAPYLQGANNVGGYGMTGMGGGYGGIPQNIYGGFSYGSPPQSQAAGMQQQPTPPEWGGDYNGYNSQYGPSYPPPSGTVMQGARSGVGAGGYGQFQGQGYAPGYNISTQLPGPSLGAYGPQPTSGIGSGYYNNPSQQTYSFQRA